MAGERANGAAAAPATVAAPSARTSRRVIVRVPASQRLRAIVIQPPSSNFRIAFFIWKAQELLVPDAYTLATHRRWSRRVGREARQRREESDEGRHRIGDHGRLRARLRGPANRRGEDGRGGPERAANGPVPRPSAG